MIVIADSGSTKTDWCLGNTKTNSRTVRTGGINPFHQSVDEIKEVIASTLIPQLGDTTEFTTIYFYGAGCIPEKTNIVKTALAQNFPKANILVKMGSLFPMVGKNLLIIFRLFPEIVFVIRDIGDHFVSLRWKIKVFVTRGGLKSQNVSQRIEYSKGISIRSTNKKRMAKTLYYNPIFYMNFGPDPKKKAKFLEKVKGGHLLNIVPTSSGREVLSYFEGDELIAYQLTDKIYIFQDTCRFYIEKAGIVYDVFPEGIKPRYRINKGECQGFLTKEEFLTQVFTKKCHVFVK